MAEPAIKKLGTFLADLTHDKPPDQVHQEILDRLRDPDQELDHRLAGIYLHVKDFVPIWTAIRNGVSLPASSWETVVLPVVVHFSPPQHVKQHLESATSMFLNARGGREIESDPVPAPVYDPEPMSLLDSVFDNVEDDPAPPPARPAPAIAGVRTGRRWVPQAAAVAIVAVAAVLIWTGGGGKGLGGNSFAGLPKRPSVTIPTPEPSATPSAEPMASGSPTPAPGTSTAPPPAPPHTGQPPRAPGAPTGLVKTTVTRDSIGLTWTAPADAANVAFYKVFKDGVAFPQTVNTADTAIGLQPATAYTFVVRAYNRAGQESPASNSIIVTTNGPMQTTFHVPVNVPFGSSFAVGGTGWACRDVRILIAGDAVEIGKVDEFGSFDAQINVHDQDGQSGWVDLLSSSQRIQLVQGKWTLTASCPGGPSISDSIYVVAEDPMNQPSAPPG